jgi:hypothetical protein
MKHYPETPTSCNVSDMLNSIAQFVEEYPDWANDRQMVGRMAMAYMMLTKMSDPEMVSEDEYEFVMNLHSTLQEINND